MSIKPSFSGEDRRAMAAAKGVPPDNQTVSSASLDKPATTGTAESVTSRDVVDEAVTRTEAINETLTNFGRTKVFGLNISPVKVILLFCLFLVGYVSNLDAMMSGSFQTYAANEFANDPAIGTINTVKSLVAAALLVPYARMSDRVGRMEMWIVATFILTIGRIVTAATPNFGGLFVGTILWECGYAGYRMLATAMTGDFSKLKDRTFAMNIFLIPIIINMWVSGDIVASLAGKVPPFKWRWGFGIGCITIPVAVCILAVPFYFAQLVTYRQGRLPELRWRRNGQSHGRAILDFILEVDIIGVLLFAAALVLILVPLTIAGGSQPKWSKGYIIALICIGGAGFMPAFLIWEWKISKAPFVPRNKLGKTFWAAMGIEFFSMVGGSIVGTRLRTLLLVAFDQTPKSSQRLGQMHNFLQACAALVMGVILHFFPYPKVSVVLGQLMALAGTGLMYKYRTAFDGIAGYIGGELLVGIGDGMTRFPMYTLVHADIPHAHMAVATGFMFSFYQVGQSVGAAIGTAIWTNLAPERLIDRLGPRLGAQAYKQPVALIKKYPLGSFERTMILDVYSEIQRLLVICGLAFAALTVVLTWFLRSYSVKENKQSFTDEEREEKLRELRQGSLARRTFRQLVGI